MLNFGGVSHIPNDKKILCGKKNHQPNQALRCRGPMPMPANQALLGHLERHIAAPQVRWVRLGARILMSET